WDKSLLDPYAAVHSGAFDKHASAVLDEENITAKDLARVKEEDFKRAFGQSMWNTFKADPVAIFEHFPKPEKRTILDMIK
ncbi:MAG: hypothetical protein KDA17_08315, partial [Candidatus Saccharibacteria bacterium]|nr:hypothetical protein [Candidatus Saccharibacteria bacterium]